MSYDAVRVAETLEALLDHEEHRPKHRRTVPAEHYVDPVFDPRPQAEHQFGKWCPVCTPGQYAAQSARHRAA